MVFLSTYTIFLGNDYMNNNMPHGKVMLKELEYNSIKKQVSINLHT